MDLPGFVYEQGNVTITGSQSGSHMYYASGNENLNIIHLNAVESFSSGETIIVTLGTGICNAGMANIEAQYEFSFTVQANMSITIEIDPSNCQPNSSMDIDVVLQEYPSGTLLNGATVAYSVRDQYNNVLSGYPQNCAGMGIGLYQASFTSPGNPGPYNVLVTATHPDYLSSSNSENFTVDPPSGHELSFSGVTPDGTVISPGGNVTFMGSLYNTGQEPETGITINISATGPGGYSSTQNQINVGTLNPGEYFFFNDLVWSHSASYPDGNYAVSVNANCNSGAFDQVSFPIYIGTPPVSSSFEIRRFWTGYISATPPHYYQANLSNHTYRIVAASPALDYYDAYVNGHYQANIINEISFVYNSDLIYDFWPDAGQDPVVFHAGYGPANEANVVCQPTIATQSSQIQVNIPSNEYDQIRCFLRNGNVFDVRNDDSWINSPNNANGNFTMTFTPQASGIHQFALEVLETTTLISNWPTYLVEGPGYVIFGEVDVLPFFDYSVSLPTFSAVPVGQTVEIPVTLQNVGSNSITSPASIEVNIYDNLGQFVRNFTESSTAGTTTFEWETAGLDGGDYDIIAQISNLEDMNALNNSDESIIYLDAPPPPPLLSLPENGAPSIAINPTHFDWEDAPDAISYGLQIDEEITFGEPYTLFETGIQSSEYDFNDLEYSTLYYWRVYSDESSDDTSGWSEIYNFTTDAMPTLNVSPGMFTYEVNIGDPNPGDETIIITNIGGSSFAWEAVLLEATTWCNISPQTGGPLYSEEYSEIIISLAIAGLTEGTYTDTIQITAEGAQGSPATIPVNLTVTSTSLLLSIPNGSEIWNLDEAENITWSSSNLTGDISIELNRDYPAGNWEMLADVVDITDQSWNWAEITGDTTDLARIRITSLDDPYYNDESDSDFTIRYYEGPINLYAMAGDQQVELNWELPQIDGFTNQYRIQRGEEYNSLITIVDNYDLTTYTDTGLNNGQTYWYSVGCIYHNGDVAYSDTIDATPGMVVLTLPFVEGEENSEVEVPITVASFSEVGGVELYIGYDETVLEFAEVINENLPEAIINSANGQIHIAWEDFASPVTLEDDEVLITIVYDAIGAEGSTSELTFENIELVNANGEPLTADFENGLFTTLAFSGVTLALPTLNGSQYEIIEILILVTNFLEVAGVELHIVYDETVLEFLEVINENLANATINAANGQVHIIWDDYANPVTLQNDETLIALVFDVIGLAGDTSGLTFENIELANASGEPMAVEFENGLFTTLAFSGVTLVLPTITGFQNEIIEIPVTVTNFYEVAGVELHVGYDETVLEFAEVINENLPDATINSSNGQVHIIWDDYANPVTLEDDETLAALAFDVVGLEGNTCEMVFENCELADANGDPLLSVCQPGLFTALGISGITLALPSVSSFQYETIEIPITANNFVEVAGVELHIQYDNQLLAFNALTMNPLFYNSTIGELNGQINIIWDEFALPVTLATGEEIAIMEFNISGNPTSYSELEFISCELADEFGEVMSTRFNNGVSYSALITSPPVITVAIQDQNVILDWDECPGANDYSIYRSAEPYFIPEPSLLQEFVIDPSYTDLGAVSGGSYFYIVTVNYGTAAEMPVKINEVYYDHTGIDERYEFIELYNTSDEAVNLSGWVVQWAGPNFGNGSLVFSDLVIQPQGYLLIGGEMVEEHFSVPPDLIYNFDFPNGGITADGIRICLGSGYYDTVLYGIENSNNLPGDDNTPGIELCSDVLDGQSLERVVPGGDSNQVSDWQILDNPTPMGSGSTLMVAPGYRNNKNTTQKSGN